MKDKGELINSLSIKLRKKTGSYFSSIEELSLEYDRMFPEDIMGNSNLKNYIRKESLGLNTITDLRFLNNHFKEM